MSEDVRKFATGAVRSKDADDVRYDLISPIALEALAATYAEGANKYSSFNWERGMPAHDLLNHAIRHIYRFLAGDRSEEHLPHALWNVGAAIHSLALWPHLNEGTLREPGCRPPGPPAESGVQGAGGERIPETEEEFFSAVDDVTGMCARGSDGANTMPPRGAAPVTPNPTAISAGDVTILGNSVAISRAVENHESGQANTNRGRLSARERLLAALVGGRAEKPVLYLSGPMSGIPDYNFPRFNAAAEVLRAKGFPTINPADFGVHPEKSWEDHLQRDLFLVGHADILVQLPGWELSRGASLELSVAEQLGKIVATYKEVANLP